MGRPKRISLQLHVAEHTPNGQLIQYLKNNTDIEVREAMLRALRAFYLPVALQGDPETVQQQARIAISELHYRAFQLQVQFNVDLSDRLVFSPSTLPTQLSAGDRRVACESPELLDLPLEEAEMLNLSQVLDDF